MKSIKLGTVVISLMICLMAVRNDASAKDPDEYVWGGMQALSGPGFGPGVDAMVKGSNLAVEEINRAGGVGGKKMDLIWEDHKAKGPDAVAGLNKLISINHVPVVSIGYTAPIMACAPIGDQKKVLLINNGAYGPVLSGAGKYLFHIPANELVMIRAILDYGKKNFNLKSIGVIHVNDDMGISVRDFIRSYSKKIGVEFAGSEAFDLSASDYSVQIGKAKRWKADAIYLSSHGHPNVIKQAYEKGWTPQWIGCPLYTYPEFLTNAGKGLTNAIAVSADISMERYPALRKVKEVWERKYGPGSWLQGGVSFIGYCWDIPYIVKSLIEYGKKKQWEDYWTGEKLRQALLDIRTFDGCMGKITFDPKTGLSYRNVQLFRAVENPDKPGIFAWKGIVYYTPDQIEKLGE